MKSESYPFTPYLNLLFSLHPRSSPERWKYVVYLLAINSGLRAGEIWGLKPQDILQNGEIILFQRQYDRVRKEYRPIKGKKNRRAPCNSELFGELTEIIKSQKIQPDDPIFQNESRRSIDHDNFRNRTFKSQLECHSTGKSAIEGQLRDFFNVVPDNFTKIENLFQDGEWAVLEWSGGGTFKPTGKKFTFEGCGFFRVLDGKIKFQRGYWDMATWSKRVGVPLE